MQNLQFVESGNSQKVLFADTRNKLRPSLYDSKQTFSSFFAPQSSGIFICAGRAPGPFMGQKRHLFLEPLPAE